MVDTTQGFQQIFLTYQDIREANPNWSDKMIEDYLALKRDLTLSTEQADISEDYNFANLNQPVGDVEPGESIYDPIRSEPESPELRGASIIEPVRFNNLAAGDSSLTTTGPEMVLCFNTAAATVTLNPYPADGESVKISRRNAAVTVSGPINGGTSIMIALKYDTAHLIYSIIAGEWVIT